MKKLGFLILFLVFAQMISAQDSLFPRKNLGVNVMQFLGNSLGIYGEYQPHKLYSITASTGIMINYSNYFRYDVDDWVDDEICSGAYLSFGGRFTLPYRSHYAFLGGKAVGGYFWQSAEYSSDPYYFSGGPLPEEYEYRNGRVYARGWFLTMAIEGGVNLHIRRRFHIELGLQIGMDAFVEGFYIDNPDRLSDLNTVMPGMGAVELMAIVKPKLFF